jgi:hypothetical protein
MVELPEASEAGLKLAVAPEGRPEMARPTVPLKPLSGVTEAVYVVLPPAAMVRDEGVAESEKFAGEFTWIVNALVCVMVPVVPVIVSG